MEEENGTGKEKETDTAASGDSGDDILQPELQEMDLIPKRCAGHYSPQEVRADMLRLLAEIANINDMRCCKTNL